MTHAGETDELIRREEITYVMDCIADGSCCSIVGISNMGKSDLLRAVYSVEARKRFLPGAEQYVFIHIDFNLMVALTEQGFYELILRSTLAELKNLRVSQTLLEQAEAYYDRVVDPSTPFLSPLSFNECMIALGEGLGQSIVLLCDEFDEAFGEIDARVFLNLRALRDRFAERLIYVICTEQQLEESRTEPEVIEFCEMFAHHTLFLGVLNDTDARKTIKAFAREEGVEFSVDDEDFVVTQAGGHPGLLRAVCHVLIQTGGDPPSYKLVRERLDSDHNVRGEGAKLWNDLTSGEQDALIAFVDRGQTGLSAWPPDVGQGLRRKGILVTGKGTRLRVFGALFEGFACRQKRVRVKKGPPGVWVDVDAGDVWVDGELTPTLTDLEYRLLLLFYGRLNKLCDKYQIVETVWGEEYIDEVDDARIDKLVSRLRRKIERHPGEPHYLITVRGRGYKLVGG
ncbi:MAG: winged helix-turn-helix domain-containing protein [Chloroflexota bacterium]|nr:winged helix-turn-helix domain-containing protein [Chloroflexota bacterium]